MFSKIAFIHSVHFIITHTFHELVIQEKNKTYCELYHKHDKTLRMPEQKHKDICKNSIKHKAQGTHG